MGERERVMEARGVELAYERVEARGRVPRWVVGVMGAYAVMLLALLALPALVYWENPGDPFDPALVTIGGLVVGGMVAWVALLMVPVRVASRRPVARRSIWYPLIGSGFLIGLLVFAGAVCAVLMFVRDGDTEEWMFWTLLALGVLAWAGWAGVFWVVTRRTSAEAVGMKLYKYVLAGSALELVVAVPSHVIVRRRGDCCAPVVTGSAIVVGAAVALVAFGPGVLMLYYRRMRGISGGRAPAQQDLGGGSGGLP